MRAEEDKLSTSTAVCRRLLCPHRGKLIGGCRFEPRYDYGPPVGSVDAAGRTTRSAISIIEATKPRTYVGDVCIRCGEFVRRP